MVLASVVVATHNRAPILQRTLQALDRQRLAGGYEVLVVDDGSTDETPRVLARAAKQYPWLRVFRQPRPWGPAAARNRGIAASSGAFIVILDDDCIPEPGWLAYLLAPFQADPKLGVCSTFSYYGGTSTAYRREVLARIGGFDPAFPKNYREDTDTVFRALDLGYTVRRLPRARFHHEHPPPRGLWQKLRFAWARLAVHSVDPLLYKKHPRRAAAFLDIRFGFLRNPWRDFEVATGLWWKKERDFRLASPQGVTLIENHSPLHALAIVAGGIAYAVLVKLVRLYGSLRYGKLLL